MLETGRVQFAKIKTFEVRDSDPLSIKFTLFMCLIVGILLSSIMLLLEMFGPFKTDAEIVPTFVEDNQVRIAFKRIQEKLKLERLRWSVFEKLRLFDI